MKLRLHFTVPFKVYNQYFFVRVHFDTDEIGDGEGESADNRGFCLSYVQQPCTS